MNLSPRILHHGAAEGVTGSCHRLQIDAGRALLVDCGLFQGQDIGPVDHLERHRIEFPVDDLLALIVTHVHIDHIGRLPWLLAAGYQGPILCSVPSARLLPLVIEDALRVGFTRDAALIERFLERVGGQLVALEYGAWHTLLDDARHRVRVRLQRAGHILGSAYVEVDLRDKSASADQRIVFSGDLGAPHAPLLPAPRSPYKADVLVLESTYGDRRHENRRDRRLRLKAAIDHALDDGGTVLIPAFSIGRTQELLYELEGLIHDARDARWRELEIIVDSPLAARFTEVYRELKPRWDAEARRPAVVLAASGMAAGGRIVDYLKAMLEDPRHNVLFVGYQAPGTPGHAIQRYGPRGGWVELDGKRYTIRAGVDSISGYSAHADRDDLIRFVRGMRRWPRRIRLINGDRGAREALRDGLLAMARERGRELEVIIPERAA